MRQQYTTTRAATPETILPMSERKQADKAAAVARSMDNEAKRFAITYMRAYQGGYQAGYEKAMQEMAARHRT